jgi:Xaa-Pro aminopeptidase
MLKKLAPHMRLVDKGGVVECYRRQKDEGEIKLISRAQRITKELLRRVPSALRPGITEEKLARQLQIWALELGADCLSFDAIVAFGTHTGFPHHVPTSRTLKKGHIVQIDVGATVRGYCSDMSRVFFTAPPTPQQKLVYDTLLKAQKRAMDAVKPGVGTAELDRLAREVLKSQGIEEAFCHSLGHGVGLEIHEGITLSQLRKSVELLQGEVITIEPGVYFPGKFGMRIEDMVIV